MNTLTIVVIAIFAVLIILGYVRGLLRTVCGTVVTIISIVLAYFVAPLASELVCQNTNIDNYFDDLIYEMVEEAVGETINNQVEGVVGNLPDKGKETVTDIAMKLEPTKAQQEEFIDKLDVPDFAKKMLKADNNKATRKSLGVNNFYRFISAYIARMIVNALTFLCMFVAIYIVSQIIMVTAGILSRLPIIKGANRMGGALLGAVEAILLIWALFLIVAVVINTDFGKEIYSQIEDSIILKTIYDSNIFLPLVTKM